MDKEIKRIKDSLRSDSNTQDSDIIDNFESISKKENDSNLISENIFTPSNYEDGKKSEFSDNM